MIFSHDDIRERLIDFLYGELDGEARAAFTAHVDGCELCRAEVTGAEQARALGRAVARAPLSDEVPSRVRVAVLAAARAAGQEKAMAATPGLTIAARAAAAPQQSWFDRLRRRWTFPTFATVAAMAAFLLVRATIFREAKRPLGEQGPGELARKEPQLPAPAAAPTVAVPEAQAPAAFEGRGEDAVVGVKAARPRLRVSAPHKSGGAPTGRGAGVTVDRDDAFAQEPPLGGLGALGSSDGGGATPRRDDVGKRLERRRAAPASQPAPTKPTSAFAAEGASPSYASDKRIQNVEKDEAPSPVSHAAAEPKGGGAEGELKKEVAAPVVQREFAAPPPPPAPSAAPPRAASEDSASGAPSPARSRGAADHLDALAAPALAKSAPAPAPEQTSAVKKSKARQSEGANADADVGPADGDPASVLVVRAEGLMTAHRWAAAVTAYRDLLRRFPKHPAAPTWRNRLAAAQAAAAAEEGQIIR
ncbi:MAG TPA: zf-HC2 domain-containing protein [Polyangia bacterium]|jgi:anti-sigma factor RsiW